MMKDMSLSAEEAKEYSTPGPGDAPKYPYGLSICLGDDSLTKLGIGQLPQPGSKVIINAIATVTGVGQNQEADGEVDRNMDLQIVSMELDIHSTVEQKTDYANKLYGDADE